MPAEATEIVNSEFYTNILPSKDADLLAFNEQYLEKHKDCPEKLRGGLFFLFSFDPLLVTLL